MPTSHEYFITETDKTLLDILQTPDPLDVYVVHIGGYTYPRYQQSGQAYQLPCTTSVSNLTHTISGDIQD